MKGLMLGRLLKCASLIIFFENVHRYFVSALLESLVTGLYIQIHVAFTATKGIKTLRGIKTAAFWCFTITMDLYYNGYLFTFTFVLLPGISLFLEECWRKKKKRPRVNPFLCLGKIIYNVLDRCLSNLLIAGNSTAFLKQLILALHSLTAYFSPSV